MQEPHRGSQLGPKAINLKSASKTNFRRLFAYLKSFKTLIALKFACGALQWVSSGTKLRRVLQNCKDRESDTMSMASEIAKFLFEAQAWFTVGHQAANPCGVLAWCYYWSGSSSLLTSSRLWSRVLQQTRGLQLCNSLNAWNPMCFIKIHCQLNSANGWLMFFWRQR